MRSKELKIYLLADNVKNIYDKLISNWQDYFRVSVTYIKEQDLVHLKQTRVDFLFVDESYSADLVNLALFNDIRELNANFKIIWSLTDINDKAYKLLKFGADDIIYYCSGQPYLRWKTIAILRRRWEGFANDNVIFHRGLIIDFPNHNVYINQEELELSKKEFAVLKYLIQNTGFVSREELYKKVWKYKDEDSTRVVQQILQKLKNKIGSEYFKTIRNKGIKLV